jgi:lincosamide nucleotidyltransferase A/C/D/E
MMSAADVIDVIALLSDARIAVWVDGGWGIDALIGEQTRPHDDLDLVIDRGRNDDVIAALATYEFLLHLDQRPVSFVMRDARDRRIDFHPVRFDSDGGGWQAQPDGSEFRYSHDGLSGTGTIAGQAVRCLTAEFQVVCHYGYLPDTNDFHDMGLLRDRFGIRLLSPYDQ